MLWDVRETDTRPLHRCTSKVFKGMHAEHSSAYGNQGVGYLSPPVVTFHPSLREDQEKQPDKKEFHHDEHNFLFMSWNAGNTGRSTAACGLLANAISLGARITALQETPSDSIALAKASYRGATTISGGMNTLSVTCTSAMIRAISNVFSERDYGTGVLYRAWIDINGKK